MSLPAANQSPKVTPAPKMHGGHDTTREIFETVVFVVVLVLMLKLFVAEAFVIPTGSMASTLWGDQVRCTCRECGHFFPINASNGGERAQVDDYVCENCGFWFKRWFDRQNQEDRRGLNQREYEAKYRVELSKDISSPSSGDRVLVSKYQYHIRDPHRFEVPVFKFPKEPYSRKERSGMNYIKRLVGLGGETVAVFDGDLYTNRALTYDHLPTAERPKRDVDAWLPRYMYPNDEVAAEQFRAGKYEIVRKSPDEILAMRRLVFNLDHQPKNREGIRRMRWHPQNEKGAGWEMQETGFKHNGAGDTSWMCYQHINPWNNEAIAPFYIVDFLGYNLRDNVRDDFRDVGRDLSQLFTPNYRDHWVSDLVLDCTVEIASPDAEVALELSKGRDRFRATFAKGECKLARVTTSDAGIDEIQEMGSHPTPMTKSGKYALRLANVDSRMTVWVDGKALAFGRDQSDYPPPNPKVTFEPFEPNDLLQPARIGAKGEVVVSKVSLWRDLLYRCGWPQIIERSRDDDDVQETDWKQLPSCGDLQTYYVQPGHYLMFGDNVNSSADSRTWGTVPSRLMLGRAVVVYWPFARMGVIE